MNVSSVQDGIYTLGKAHMHFMPSLRSFSSVASEIVPVSMAFSFVKKDRQALPLSTPISSLLLAIDGVMSLALCPPFVMVASPASLSALSFLLTPLSRTVYGQESLRVDVEHCDMPVWSSHCSVHLL